MLFGHGDDIYDYQDIRINFSSNICQHADHSALKKHLMAHFDTIANYPEPEPWTLERAIARKYGIEEDCVLVTNGTTDAIYLIAQAYAALPYNILHPTFSEYEDACRMYGMQQGSGHLTWVCSPNNPTGETRTLDQIRQQSGGYEILIIDQAYENCTSQRMMSPKEAINEGNIIQLHSMTKTYAVPGLRLGYITAAPPHISQLRKFLKPWSVNALAIEAALFLLKHDELMVKPDLNEAQRLYRKMNEIEGVSVLPTDTNYMLCSIERHTATELKDHLAREYGMLIRDASNFKGLNNHFFRIAAQLPEENDALIDAVSHYVGISL